MKKIVLLLLMMIPALLFAGGQAEEAGETGIVKLEYWTHFSAETDQEAKDLMIETFNKENPGIKVIRHFTGSAGSTGLTDKLLTAIAGGTPPDVAVFDRFRVNQWASEDLFEDLSEIAKKKGVTKDLFYDFAWEEATTDDGRLFAMPFTTDTRVLFYNKDHFRAAGLDPEKPPTSIAELDEYARKLTIMEGDKIVQLGFYPPIGQGWLYTWGWAFGGHFQDKSTGKITANDPNIVKALEWMVSYANKLGATTVGGFVSQTESGTGMNPFYADKLSMMISGPWDVARIPHNNPDIDWGIANIPTPSGTNFNSWAGGYSHVIPKGVEGNRKEAAFDFAKFVSAEEGAVIFANHATFLMCSKDVMGKISWADDPKYKLFVDLLPVAFCRPPISQGDLLWNELADAQEAALFGKGSAKDLLDSATEKVNKELGF